MFQNIAIITGASSGIGREMVFRIAENYDIDEIWMIARRKDRLLEVASCLYEEFGINSKIITLDLLKLDSFRKISMVLQREKPFIKVLVNSSGFGFVGESCEISQEKQADMIKLNCLALFRMTRICSDYMDFGGKIVQIASAAAFVPQPYFAVYAATKSFVLSYSIAINEELKSRGISVMAVCPGPVDTEFFDIALENGEDLMYGKKFFMKSPESISRGIIRALNRNKAVYTPGISMKSLALISGLPMALIAAAAVAFFHKSNE